MKSRILYLIIYVCLLPLAGCNVHEWPDKRETVSFLLQLNFHPAMGEMDYFYTRGSSRAVAGHDMRYAIDPTKMETQLGWKPKYNFDTGIQQTIQWYLDNKEWWQNILSGEYTRYFDTMYGERLK